MTNKDRVKHIEKDDFNSGKVARELNGNARISSQISNGTTTLNGNPSKAPPKSRYTPQHSNGNSHHANGVWTAKPKGFKVYRKRSSSSKGSETSGKSTCEDRTDIDADEENLSTPPPAPSTSPPHETGETDDWNKANSNGEPVDSRVNVYEFYQREKDRSIQRCLQAANSRMAQRNEDAQYRNGLTVNRSTIDDKNGTRRLSERSLYSDTFHNKSFLELKQPLPQTNHKPLGEGNIAENAGSNSKILPESDASSGSLTHRASLMASKLSPITVRFMNSADEEYSQMHCNQAKSNGPNRTTCPTMAPVKRSFKPSAQTCKPTSSLAVQTDAMTSDGFLSFHSQSPWDKFETMCQLVRSFEAFDMRFFATCVEASARNQATSLRGTEDRANSSESIQRLAEMKASYSETCNYLYSLLALLFGTSRKEANIYFEVLQKIINRRHTELAGIEKIEEKLELIEKLGKLISAAIYHPAFSITHAAQLINWREEVWSQREQLNLQLAQEQLQKERGDEDAGASASTCPRSSDVPHNKRSSAPHSLVSCPEYIYTMHAVESGFRANVLPIEVTWSDGIKSFIGLNKKNIFKMHFLLLDEFGLENSHVGERVLHRLKEDGSDEEYISYINKLSDMPARIILSSIIRDVFYESRQGSDQVNKATKRHPSCSFTEQSAYRPSIAIATNPPSFFNSYLSPPPNDLMQPIPIQTQKPMTNCHVCAGFHSFDECPEKFCGSRVGPEGLRLKTHANDPEPSQLNREVILSGPPLAPISSSPHPDPNISPSPLTRMGTTMNMGVPVPGYPPPQTLMSAAHAQQLQMWGSVLVQQLIQLSRVAPGLTMGVITNAADQISRGSQMMAPPIGQPPLPVTTASEQPRYNYSTGTNTVPMNRSRCNSTVSSSGPNYVYTKDPERDVQTTQKQWRQGSRKENEPNTPMQSPPLESSQLNGDSS